jgi:ribosomal protein S12 methylthiotransferase
MKERQRRHRVYCISLGCPKNMVDTETILGHLCREGFIPVSRPQDADVILVNTCSFVDDAKEESIETVLEAARWKERGSCRWLVVSGCLPQLYGTKLRELLPEVDLMAGTGDLPGLARRLTRLFLGAERGVYLSEPGYLTSSVEPRVRSAQTPTAYVKIAEGCSHVCSFCTIPKARGPFRSRTVESVLEEAQLLARQGVRELILVAQDTTAFGMDRTPKGELEELLRALDDVEGLRWIRLLYAHPAHVTEELLCTLPALRHLCPYIDLPIQHINEDILRAMKRGTSSESVRRLITSIRGALPHVFIRTSVILGFPGETDEAFEELLEFIEEARFVWLGVFEFSPQEGTQAASLPHRPDADVVRARMERLMEVQRRITRQRLEALLGERVWVLVEGKAHGREGLFWGRTSFQAPEVDGITFVKGRVKVGEFCLVRIEEVRDYDLLGSVVQAAERAPLGGDVQWDHAGGAVR